MKNNKKNLTITSSEAHLASLCVAIVSGGIGGILAIMCSIVRIKIYTSISLEYLLNNVDTIILAGILGFCVSWIVCKYLFKSAHRWYGSKSWYHRVYDLVGVVSGTGVYWILSGSF